MITGLPVIGTWRTTGGSVYFEADALPHAIARYRSPAYIVREVPAGRIGVGVNGELSTSAGAQQAGSYPCLGVLPALYPEWLGDRAFLEVHGVRFPYVAGAMARGIASEALVIELARAGMMGFFGAGGLGLQRVESALVTLQETLGESLPWGCNLIHSPQEPELENQLAALLLRRAVRRVEASAFMYLTPAVVRYACTGVTRDAAGQLQRANHVFAKVGRPEVDEVFRSLAPQANPGALVLAGELSREEATLARELPVAEDVTV